MALYSNLHDYRFNDTDVDDIRGAAVYGSDNEKLGKIDDVIFDNASGELRYVVVDSGGWLSSKKFIVPARQLMIREEQDKDFHVSMTKEQIQKLPEYNEKEIESDEKWTDYEGRYKTAWGDGPVLHREGSTHILTPEAVEGAGSGSGAEVHVSSPRRIAHDMPRFGATSSSDTSDGVSLAGEDDISPTITGTRKTIARQIDEPIPEEARGDGDLREDNIGTASIDRINESARLRAFEERLRRDREEILRKRRDRAA